MLPGSVMRYAPNNVIGQIQLLCYGVNGHGFKELSYPHDIRFCYFRRIALFALIVVRGMFALFEVFKIVRAIVEPCFVFVVYLVPIGTRANKGERNKFMDVVFAALVFLKKPKVIVAALDAQSFVFCMMSLSVAALSGYALRKTLYLAHIAYLIQAFVVRYIAPFFKRELGLNQAWSMITHVVSPFVTIGLIRQRVDARWPVLSCVLLV